MLFRSMNNQASAEQSSLQENGGICIHWRLLDIRVQGMKHIGERYNAYGNRMRTRHYNNSHLPQGNKVHAAGVQLLWGRYDALGVRYATRMDLGSVLPSRERDFVPQRLEGRGCTTARGGTREQSRWAVTMPTERAGCYFRSPSRRKGPRPGTQTGRAAGAEGP